MGCGATKVQVVEQDPVMSSEDKTDDCRFFCPLCMLFYERMLKANCCGQYICIGCATAYMNGKNIDCDTAALLGELPPTDCPYCTKPPVKFVEVSSSELARNYEDSPAVAQKLASRIPAQAPGAPSPLKTGDSYEDMKRKMTFFDETKAVTPVKAGATNPGAVASAALDSSSSGNIRTALETSLRSMPTVPESPGQSSSIGSSTPPGTPASAGSAAASPYVSQLDIMEEDGQPGNADPATPRDDAEMDRSCPAGLANALAAAGAGHVSVLDEASLIAPNGLLDPEPEQEPPSGPGEDSAREQERQPEDQSGREPEQREEASSMPAAVDGPVVPEVPPSEDAATPSEPRQAEDASADGAALPSPPVDVSDMPDAVEEAADNPAVPPPSE